MLNENSFLTDWGVASESRTCEWLWMLRSMNLTRRDRYHDANQCYRQALRIDPVHDPAYLNIGLNFLANGRYQRAHSYFRKAQSLDDTQEVREAIAQLEYAEDADRIAQDILNEHL
jgi:Flp pilus assembly protein TadD